MGALFVFFVQRSIDLNGCMHDGNVCFGGKKEYGEQHVTNQQWKKEGLIHSQQYGQIKRIENYNIPCIKRTTSGCEVLTGEVVRNWMLYSCGCCGSCASGFFAMSPIAV